MEGGLLLVLAMVVIRLFRIKTWEMECSAVTILTETTQVGSVLSASKKSSASSSLPPSLSPFVAQPLLLPLLLLDLTLAVLLTPPEVLASPVLPLPLSRSRSRSVPNPTASRFIMMSTTPGGPGSLSFWPRRRRR